MKYSKKQVYEYVDEIFKYINNNKESGNIEDVYFQEKVDSLDHRFRIIKSFMDMAEEEFDLVLRGEYALDLEDTRTEIFKAVAHGLYLLLEIKDAEDKEDF